MAVTCKKRSKQNEDRFVVDSYHCSLWRKIEEVSLDLLKGLDLQAVYENLIKSLLQGGKDAQGAPV